MPKTTRPERKRAEEVLHRLGKEKKNLPHLTDLAEHFVELSGGPRKFARMLYDEYLESPAGGIVRQRILDLVTRVWRHADEKKSGTNDLGLLTQDDLERQLKERLKALGFEAEKTDGEGTPGPAAAPEKSPEAAYAASILPPAPGAAASPAAAPGAAPAG